MTDDEIELKIDGRDVRPEAISVGDLAYILDNLERAVKAVARANGDDPEAVLITLAGVQTGSGKFPLKANNPARSHTTTVVMAIEQRDASLLPPDARRYIGNVHGRIRTKNWSCEINGKSRNGVPFRALVRPDTPLFESPKTWGATSIVAKVIKAGGEGRHRSAELRLADGTHITAKISSHDLTIELGGSLFKELELHGRAIWDANTWHIQTFTITDIGPFRKETSNPTLALEQLREANGGFWDTIDVSTYLNDLRAGDSGVFQ
jgi:hypothetical protein